MDLMQKLPGWVFVIAMFIAAITVVLIAWGAILVLRDVDKISLF
jgi:hypothetical protein